MTVMHEASPGPVQSRSQSRQPWWELPEIWGSLGLVAMWLAVLFVGVYGGDMRFVSNDGNSSSVPSVIVVAICAALATTAVARRMFRR
jgi:hypothetical protein